MEWKFFTHCITHTLYYPYTFITVGSSLWIIIYRFRAFLILSPLLQNFRVVLPTKKLCPLFLISRSKSLSPFFSLSFAGLLPTFSFSLCFSCSIFQICGHDNMTIIINPFTPEPPVTACADPGPFYPL